MNSVYTRTREDPRKAYSRKGERESSAVGGEGKRGEKLKYARFY